MKKLLIASLVATSFASQAIELNPDKNGQVLLFPYYTVNEGFSTAIHLTNTTNKTKAIKVRFSEGKNTWEVLDFNLYMSPFDVWTATLSRGTNGGVVLKTTDTSCTVPQIPSSGVSFRNTLYSGNDNNGNGQIESDQSFARLQEGHFEVIEMGEVLDNDPNNFATAIKHTNGVPSDCSSLTESWESGAWSVNRNTDMSAPTGGIHGIAYMIDVVNGYQIGYDATAIDNFWNLDGIGNSAHNRPGTSFPDLNGQVEDGTTIVKLGNKESRVVANDNLLISNWTETVDALSAVLMSNSIANDISTISSVGARTDWIVSFPTKHFYVNSSVNSRNGLGPNRAPFTSEYDGTNDNGACESISLQVFDREEQVEGNNGSVDFSPSESVEGPQLCWETSRITFNNSNFYGGDTIGTLSNIDTPFSEGWARITFNNSMSSTEGHRFVGLPVIGFSTLSSKNGTLNGGTTLANYAAAFEHKRKRSITN